MVDTRRSSPQQKRRGRDLRDRITGGPSGSRGRRDATDRPSQQQSGSAPSRSDFTFTSDMRAPQFPPATQVEGGARRNRRHGASSTRPRYGARNHGNARGGFRPQPAHDRALLRARDDGTEQFLGVPTKSRKFRDLADLSDDEDASMDTDSTDKPDSGDSGVQSKTKLARTQSSSHADGSSVPKWSNPDPYTVLPPPEETTGKGFDVVKFIRKAKMEVAEQINGANAVAANDDFIAFGDDDDEEGKKDTSLVAPSVHVPSAQPLQGSLNEVAATESLRSANSRTKRSAESAGLPARVQHADRSRKRKQTADELAITEAWEAKPYMNPAPWTCPDDYRRLRNEPVQMLHNEILDFYEFVRPREHDQAARNKLIQRVQNSIGNNFQSVRGRIHCFGSFPVGLYLPTADMDLVYVSDTHFKDGPPTLSPAKNQMYKLAQRLRNSGIATDTTVIPFARVPIIKFTDTKTRLQVDISFENMSGLVAQGTLRAWKEAYGSTLLSLVALVKQLLAMYDLNDNSTGGLGGLSIICLVVSFLELQYKGEIPENQGDVFLHFLDYYGNKFDYVHNRIIMDPPKITRKGSIGIDGRREQPNRLSIQDPNNEKNNISGGSYKAEKVIELFAKAHAALLDRMEAIRMRAVQELSILECILGGDYTSYGQHRELMRTMNQGRDVKGTSSVPIIIHD